MKAPDNFEFKEPYSRFNLAGHGSLQEAAGKVIEAIAFARGQGIRKLLIDTTQWTGHDKPDALERFNVAQLFTEAAAGAVIKIAMIVRPELMDPNKFEVTVANNRGLNGNVFDSEKEAFQWLLSPESV